MFGWSKLTRDLHLAFETVNELVGRDVLLQDLDRRRALQQRVPREVDLRHAALADLSLQRVCAEALQAAELPLQPPSDDADISAAPSDSATNPPITAKLIQK